MRVLIVNTSEKTGGAAVASNRLMHALNHEGVKAKMLVRDKQTSQLTVVQLPHRRLRYAYFLWERWCIFWRLRFARRHLFEIDIANIGSDITALPEFREADMIHLEWINQGMLSLKGIRKILDSGKPVVWTMHDVWPATAICHYTRGCEAFKTGCHHCRLLPHGGSENDLSAHVWRRKQRIYGQRSIQFVTCSRWLAEQAKQSELLTGHTVTDIPNPIDTSVFRKKNREQARRQLSLPADKRIILFVSQRVTDERKGVAYLVDALGMLVDSHPVLREQAAVAVLGGHAEDICNRLPLAAYPLRYISDEEQIVDVYNAADVFVLPSLEDNLPNTIMEAMACGVPCIGFDVGGIPEMIDHRVNGFVARFKDVESLASGIRWVLDQTAGSDELNRQCIKKVMTTYAQQHVAMRYIDVYQKALAVQNNKRW